MQTVKQMFPYAEKAAARILEMSVDTLRRARKAGLIEYYEMPGGRVRYSDQQLMEFVASRRRRAPRG